MLFVGQIPVVRLRLLLPWTGAWLAEVDLDLGASDPLPEGRVLLRVGDETLSGTVDPRGSGRFGEKAALRIVGGGGAWDALVSPRHFHNDAGVLDQTVIQATAAEVGELGVVDAPVRLGVDYVRTAGPASRVLPSDWYLDAAGVTRIGARALASAKDDVEVLSWEPSEHRAELASDTIVFPGTTLVLFGGETVVARDIEQTFRADDGARATAWCASAPASRLMRALRSMVTEFAGTAALRVYRYRIVTVETDRRLVLQAVRPQVGVPDVLPVSVWPGMAGLDAELPLGSEVLVEFVEGDTAQPVVRGFAPTEGTTDFVALAALVLSRLQAIHTAFNAHVHAGLGAPPTADPLSGIPLDVAPASVAAEIVRAR